MSMNYHSKKRPLIRLVNDVIYHDNKPARIVMRKGLISVGCSDILPNALDWILEKYRQEFPEAKDCVVVQEGTE